MPAHRNVIYAQSGGVTPVINASAFGLIDSVRQSSQFGCFYAGLNGINGVLEEVLLDVDAQAYDTLQTLPQCPAGIFGSCRRKLVSIEKDRDAFERILTVCDAHDVGYFFYNGGNDSMDTVAKLSQFAQAQSAPLQVIGIPKTIDNDLAITDNCPGFGSAGKYNAISMLEASRDAESMHRDSTKVFILETMGRNAGWLAAATGLAQQCEQDGPHLILLPERSFHEFRFLTAVEQVVARVGYCTITVSEGARNQSGQLLSEGSSHDSFGHVQMGGSGKYIATLIKNQLHLKVHTAQLDYCQRSARHIAAAVDVEQAIACGQAAAQYALAGANGAMVTIERLQQSPYRWATSTVAASEVANSEKSLPDAYIRPDGMHITPAFRAYCTPLIEGEHPPRYQNGLPVYPRLKQVRLKSKLAPYAS